MQRRCSGTGFPYARGVSDRFLPRLLVALNAALAAILLTGLLATWSGRTGIVSPTGVPLAADLIKHYGAGQLTAAGRTGDLYHGGHLGDWLFQVWHGRTNTGSESFDYVYPPFVAGIASWMASAPYLAWAAGFQILLVALHLGTWPWLRRSGMEGGGLFWALWLSLPVFHYNLSIGQNGGISLWILAGSALLLQRGFPVAAGLVAACLAYKPQLAPPLALFMILAGQWRFAIAAAAGSAAWAALSVAWMGWDLHQQWLETLRAMSDGTHQVLWEYNSSVPGFLGAWAGPGLRGAGTVLGLGVMAWTAWRCRHALQKAGPAPTLFAAMAASAVWSPYMLYYDLLLAAPWWLWSLKESGLRSRAAGILFWLAVLVSVNPTGLPFNPATPLLVAWWGLTLPRTAQYPRTDPSA